MPKTTNGLSVKEMLDNHYSWQEIVDNMEFNRTLYKSNGYPNIPYIMSCGCKYIVIFGGRGTGKTYGMFDYLTHTVKEKFIYLRRTTAALETCKDAEFNPFQPINNDFGDNIYPFSSKDKLFFQKCNEEGEPLDDSVVATGVALSQGGKLRGFSGEAYNWLYFDEIIKEPLENARKGEGTAFLNFRETCNRNREQKGLPPIRCILTGNTDTLDSDILLAIDAIDIIERMKKTKQEVYINQETGLAIFDLWDSPIAAIKKEISSPSKRHNRYNDMAFNNDFQDLKNDYTVKSIPLKKCVPWFSVNETLYLYNIKGSSEVYVTYHKSGTFNINLNTSVKDDLLKYDTLYRRTIYIKMLTNNMFYQSYGAKIYMKENLR